jgi:carbonic anhydrase
MYKNRALIITALLCASHLISAAEDHATDAVPADAAVARLVEGNARFVAGTMTRPHQSIDRRAELVQGQKPFAAILTCSDSRVSPEIYFDQGLGDLFVIRNAGNVLDDHVIGSLEYAVEHLNVRLILVVGHAKCGAVSAAASGGHAPGHIKSVVESIEPAVKAAHAQKGDLVDNAVRRNAGRSAEILRQVEPFIGKLVAEGKVQVLAGYYDLATGRVEILK